MDDTHLRFPSGRNLRNSRLDAKRLSRETGIPLAQALDQVAHSNGGNATWARSMEALRKGHLPAGPLTHSASIGGLPVMSTRDVEAVIAMHPITLHGFGPYRDSDVKPWSYRDALKKGQDELLAHLSDCNKALRFLQHVDKRKTINRKVGSSYGLKHQAERFLESLQSAPSDPYVSNGGFICAAIHMGFDIKTTWDSPNVTFNMSSRSPVFEWARATSRGRFWPQTPEAQERLAALEQSLGIATDPRRHRSIPLSAK